MAMPRRPSAFRLSKYYLDCIGADGAAFIGYAASLRWGPLALRYAAALECDADGRRSERSTFTRATAPALSPAAITWQCDALGVRGEWRPRAPADTLELYADGPRAIRWHGLAPRADVSLALPGGRTLRGTGYVERLELTIEPWHLPFDTLHWGRFHGDVDDGVLYWIAWDGATRLRRIRHDGDWLADGTFERDVVRFGDTVITADATRVLHQGPVIAALARLPRVLRRVPPAFVKARETKWMSRASLSTPLRTRRGWLLHETVQLR